MFVERPVLRIDRLGVGGGCGGAGVVASVGNDIDSDGDDGGAVGARWNDGNHPLLT